MVLVKIFNKRVCEEVIFRRYGTASASSPIHILLLPSEANVVIRKAKYYLYSMPSCLSYRKIQTLFTKIVIKKKNRLLQKHKQRVSNLPKISTEIKTNKQRETQIGLIQLVIRVL